ncbi:MAG TPA: efflux RND transporter periplasmic adaptor subunit [candidate division Zixibacteria bacterium]|nr:efflux RND transporter periplasmic adaptor subunit [candidate division Zixibacteria bacterium]
MKEQTPLEVRTEDHAARPSRTRRVIVWLLVLIVFAAIFYMVTSSRTQSGAPTAARRSMGGTVTVVPATVQKGSIGVYQEAIGTVTPVYTSSITSQVTGSILAVHYREGQSVRKGDPLIDIDRRPFEAALMKDEGTLAKDTQLLAQARMDLERYQAAWKRNAIAKQLLDDQEKVVGQYEGTVKADEGQVQTDKVNLAYCHIIAPFDGRVGLRLVDPGNVVQANGTSPLVVITQERPITVIFTVAEDVLGQVQEQLRHGRKLTVDAYDRTAQRKIASGKLEALDNQIDTTTGTLKMRAVFDNQNGGLFPNQFVNARLLVNTLTNMTLVPTSAIQHNGQASFVYVLQNGTAQVRDVKPGISEGGVTAVEGVQPGEVVANSSFEKLQPNAKVTLAREQPQPQAQPASSNPGTKGAE